MKLTKGKVIGALAILVILAAAFWYGGNAPGLQGWTVGVRESSSPVLESMQPSSTPEETGEFDGSPEPTDMAGALENPASPEPLKPSENPAPTESAVPETPTPSPEGLASRPGGLEGGMTAEEKIAAAEALAGGSSAGVEKGDRKYSEANGMEINPETGKDKYLTDPVPEGKPLPVEPQDVEFSDVTHTCTLSVRCDTILDNMDWLDPEKVELVPEDGVIFPTTTVTFYEGESVFNAVSYTHLTLPTTSRV